MAEPETETSKHPNQIFILSGQSNMAGRGGVTKERAWDGVVPPECGPHPSIRRLSADLRWEPAREPLHADIDRRKACGIGPGMAFANALRRRVEGTRVSLVPCAVGGTAVREWARGEELYESMVRRAKQSVSDGDGEIKAVLWFQGESDAFAEDDALTYKVKMETLVNDLRDDLGLPLLPIIQVAIASGSEKLMEIVREAQLGMRMANVVCADAKGLPLKEDNLHLTTEAQIELGHRLADAFLRHFSPQATSGN